MHRLLTRPVPTNKTRTHAHCTLHGLQGIQQTLQDTTDIDNSSAHASGGCGYYGGATGGEDLRARHDRDRDPPAHAIGARYTRSSLHRHSLLDKGQQDDRPRAILLTGSSQRTRPYFGRPETASLRRHRAKLQQIADCRLQISDDGSRFQVLGDPDFRFQISDGEGRGGGGGGGGGNLAHEGEGCGSLQEACPEVVQR